MKTYKINTFRCRRGLKQGEKLYHLKYADRIDLKTCPKQRADVVYFVEFLSFKNNSEGKQINEVQETVGNTNCFGSLFFS